MGAGDCNGDVLPCGWLDDQSDVAESNAPAITITRRPGYAYLTLIFYHNNQIILFKHNPVKLPDIKTKNFNGKRHYKIDEFTLYPSVTTVVSILDDLSGWKNSLAERLGSYEAAEGYATHVMEHSTTVGSELHKMVEKYLNNESLDSHTKLLPRAHFENIKPLLHNIDNIRGQETAIYSHELKLAGRVDCVADYNGTPSIIDFKTARKPKEEDWIKKYFIQETAYSIMWKELVGQDINQIVTLITNEQGTTQEFIRDKNDYKQDLLDVIKQYEQINNSVKEE